MHWSYYSIALSHQFESRIQILMSLILHTSSIINTAGINSLAPGRSEYDSKNVIFNLVLLIGIFKSSHDNALWWMPQDFTDDKSTLAQVMAWCHQAPSHYLSQCWLSSLSPYDFARPQWVKEYTAIHHQVHHCHMNRWLSIIFTGIGTFQFNIVH